MKVDLSHIVVLDTGVVGLITNPTRNAGADACRAWLKRLLAANVFVGLPDVVDYELRRELVLNDAVNALQALDALRSAIEVLPVAPDVLARAASMWATLRRTGLSTADRHALDIDVIVAASTIVAAEALSLDPVVVTANAKHIGRMVRALSWDNLGI